MSAEIKRAAPSAMTVVNNGNDNKMRRRRTGRVVAGVAGGLAEHLGVQVLWVRVAFAALAAFAGAGVLAYGLLWAFVPLQSRDTAARPTSAKERQQAIGLIALGVGMAIAVGTLSGALSGWVAGGLGVMLVGAAVVWREADESQRRRWRGGGLFGAVLGEGGRGTLIRVLTGAALVITGIAIFLLRSVNLDQMQFALLAVLAALIGVAVLTVPFWLRLMRDLGEERAARISTEQRAELAERVHDSVLQTLTLIVNRADAPREVVRLARGQQRQLREQLFPSHKIGAAGQTEVLSDAIGKAVGQVEDTFGVKIDQVVVGDAPLTERLGALVQATQEAMVNAAKHAEVSEVSVYAEVEPESVTVFVRDRGKGFDAAAVPGDRHGLAESIRGRMERNGGEVRLRTALGEGTEVQLQMPRQEES